MKANVKTPYNFTGGYKSSKMYGGLEFDEDARDLVNQQGGYASKFDEDVNNLDDQHEGYASKFDEDVNNLDDQHEGYVSKFDEDVHDSQQEDYAGKSDEDTNNNQQGGRTGNFNDDEEYYGQGTKSISEERFSRNAAEDDETFDKETITEDGEDAIGKDVISINEYDLKKSKKRRWNTFAEDQLETETYNSDSDSDDSDLDNSDLNDYMSGLNDNVEGGQSATNILSRLGEEEEYVAACKSSGPSVINGGFKPSVTKKYNMYPYLL